MSSSSTKQLAGFGYVMAVAALILAWIHGDWDAIGIVLTAIGAAFVIAAVLAPRALTPLYRPWMQLAEALGWFNTRVLLILIYYLVVTPIGLVLRLFRRSPLELEEHDGSLWARPSKHSWGDRHFEKQF